MVKKPSASAGDVRDPGSIPGSGRSPGGGHGNPLQYSCLENPMDRGAWRAAVHGVTKSRTRLRELSIRARIEFMHLKIHAIYHINRIKKKNHSHRWAPKIYSFMIKNKSLLTNSEKDLLNLKDKLDSHFRIYCMH